MDPGGQTAHIGETVGSWGRPMEYRDKVLKCVECGAEFVFTAGEQAFFADKGFKNEPKRCKPCKSKRGQNASGREGGGSYQRA